MLSSLTAAIAWLTYYRTKRLLKHDLEIVWRVLGGVGLILLLVNLFQLMSLAVSGMMLESIYFYTTRFPALYQILILIDSLLAVLFALLLIKKVRKSIRLRTAFSSVLTAFVLVSVVILFLVDFNIATAMIPGWQTTIYPIQPLLQILVWVAMMIVFDLIFSKFKSRV